VTTLGSLLYGIEPFTVTASGVDPAVFELMTGQATFDHQACELEVFCRNPLHPGPCKGWKKTLGHIAPGALTAIEKAQKEKLAIKRAARTAAKSAAEKHVATGPGHVLAHPLTAKKATIEHANTLLGDAPHKAQGKAAKTILNKAEIKKYAKLKGAQIGQIAASRGLTSDEKKYAAYAESRIAEALAKDNQEGGEKHYSNLIAGLAQALSTGYASKHCGVGTADADCDGLTHEGIAALAERRLEQALTSGNTDILDDMTKKLDSLKTDQQKQAYLKASGIDLEKVKAGLYEGDGEGAPEAPSTPFDKGEKTKMDKLGQVAADQDKANAGADALAKLGEMSTGKKLTSGEHGQLAQSVGGLQKGGDASLKPLDKVIDTGVEKIAAKTKTYTGHELDAEQKAALKAELKKALAEGTPTPLLDQVKESWQAKPDAFGAPGANPDAAEELKNLGKGSGTELADAIHTGTNDEILKSLWQHPDQWGKLSPALQSVAGQKIWTERIMGNDSAAYLIGKHNIPEPAGISTPDAAVAKDAAAPGIGSQAVQDLLYYLHTPGVMSGPKLQALDNLTYAEYQALAPEDQALVTGLLKSLKGNSKAAAIAKSFDIDLSEGDAPDVEGAKISAPGTVVQIGPGAVTLNALQQEASDLATGAKSGTAKMHLATFEKLTPEEFGQLSPTTKKLIMVKLDAAEKKFTDPKKKAAVKAVKDKLSVGAGGGAGAGGKLDTTAPAGVPSAPVVPTPAVSTKLTNEDIGKQAAAEVSDMLGAVGMKPFSQKDADATGNVITKLLDNKQDAALDSVADQYTDTMIGNAKFGLPPSEMVKFGDPLTADIKAKITGTGAATPVLDAFKKAAKSGDHADLVALDKAADEWHAVNSTGKPGAPEIHALAQEYSDSFDVLKKFASGKAVTPGAGFAVIHDELTTQGLGNFATDTGGAMMLGRSLASMHMQRLSAELGLTSNQTQDWKTGGFWDVVIDGLGTEYARDLATKIDTEPLGFAADIEDFASDANKKGDALAHTNGWPLDAPAVLDWKKSYFENKVLAAMPKSAAAKVKSAAAPAPAYVPPVASPPGAPGVGSFTSATISNITEPDQHVLFSAYKSMPSGTVLSSPMSDQYDNLVAIAAHYAGQQGSGHTPSLYTSEMTKFPSDLSVAQVAKVVDARIAASLGKGNANILENNIRQWLTTEEGKNYALNAKPKPELLKALTGYSAEADKIKLKPGEKVQKIPGPGKYEPGKGPSDYAPLYAHQIQKSQEDYMTASGSWWTPDQVEALANYTTGSYHEINSYLRGQDRNGNPVDTISDLGATRIKMIQAGMRPLQQDTFLRRGTGWEQFPQGFRSPDQIKKLIGKTVREPAFMSTTVGGEGGGFFDESVLMHIEAPTGTRGAWVNHISHNKSENEVVLPAGSKFKVLDAYPNPDNPGQTIVRVRVVS
jgi:hypothetical protein